MSLANLALELEKFNVISFDFFDTLFLRKLEEPESIFDIVGKKFQLTEFRSLRKKAQQLAFAEMQQNGRCEISLDDIYNNFQELSESQKKEVKKYELKLELDVIFPNLEMLPLFNKALELGKKVVITSDMYLTESYFKEALSKYNITQVPLFISSDRNATKRDFGALFDILKSELACSAENILHIGDNQLADVEKAKLKGLSTYFYQAQTVSQRKKVPLSESIVYGLTDNRLNSFAEGSGERLAYEYGGPTIVGFCKWLKKVTVTDKIDALLYLARDGYMIKKFSDKNSNDDTRQPAEIYFKGSRTSFILSSITEYNFHEYIPYFLSGAYELSAHELFERINVVPPSQKVLDALGFYEDKAIKELDYKNVYNLISSMKKEILIVCRENRRGLHQLLVELNLPFDANIGLVDVGWNGTTQDAFENAIRPFFNYNIIGYYFCVVANSPNKKAMVNHHTWGQEIIGKIYENRVAFELLFSAPHETIIGHVPFGKSVRFIEDKRQAKSSISFAPLERGMSKFFDDYDELTSNIDCSPEEKDLIKPLINYAISGLWKESEYFSYIQNFDAWSSTKNITLSPSQYI